MRALNSLVSLAFLLLPAFIGAAEAPAPLQRLEGVVASHDRQEYRLELRDDRGEAAPLRYDASLRAYLGGHAIRWTDVQPGDRLVVLRGLPADARVAGSRTNEATTGVVESFDRRRQIFRVRSTQGRLEEFLNVPALRILRQGRRFSYADLAPGDRVTIEHPAPHSAP